MTDAGNSARISPSSGRSIRPAATIGHGWMRRGAALAVMTAEGVRQRLRAPSHWTVPRDNWPPQSRRLVFSAKFDGPLEKSLAPQVRPRSWTRAPSGSENTPGGSVESPYYVAEPASAPRAADPKLRAPTSGSAQEESIQTATHRGQSSWVAPRPAERDVPVIVKDASQTPPNARSPVLAARLAPPIRIVASARRHFGALRQITDDPAPSPQRQSPEPHDITTVSAPGLTPDASAKRERQAISDGAQPQGRPLIRHLERARQMPPSATALAFQALATGMRSVTTEERLAPSTDVSLEYQSSRTGSLTPGAFGGEVAQPSHPTSPEGPLAVPSAHVAQPLRADSTREVGPQYTPMGQKVPAIDIDALAEKVGRLLARRGQIDRERRGIF